MYTNETIKWIYKPLKNIMLIFASTKTIRKKILDNYISKLDDSKIIYIDEDITSSSTSLSTSSLINDTNRIFCYGCGYNDRGTYIFRLCTHILVEPSFYSVLLHTFKDNFLRLAITEPTVDNNVEYLVLGHKYIHEKASKESKIYNDYISNILINKCNIEEDIIRYVCRKYMYIQIF